MINTPNTIQYRRIDAFEEVAAIFAASGVEITETMLKLMSPLMYDSLSFEQHRAVLAAKISRLNK